MSEDVVCFRVPGVPVQQGSMTAGVRKDGTAYMWHSKSTALKRWREMTKTKALMAIGSANLPYFDSDLIVVRAVFVYAPLSSAPNRQWKHTAPDLDKLQRAIGDALTNVLYSDDSRVVHLTAAKVYGTLEISEGAYITVREAEQDDHDQIMHELQNTPWV